VSPEKYEMGFYIPEDDIIHFFLLLFVGSSGTSDDIARIDEMII
jgi:hypothetical protein